MGLIFKKAARLLLLAMSNNPFFCRCDAGFAAIAWPLMRRAL